MARHLIEMIAKLSQMSELKQQIIPAFLKTARTKL